jgi:hypothetical protein
MNKNFINKECSANYPKHESFNVGIKNFEDVIKVATSKRKFGSCFKKVNEGFIVYWLPKNHPQIQEFSW